MERIDGRTWRRHFRSRDISALAMALFLALAVVTVVSLVLF